MLIALPLTLLPAAALLLLLSPVAAFLFSCLVLGMTAGAIYEMHKQKMERERKRKLGYSRAVRSGRTPRVPAPRR